jgi:hypothetical protein
LDNAILNAIDNNNNKYWPNLIIMSLLVEWTLEKFFVPYLWIMTTICLGGKHILVN